MIFYRYEDYSTHGYGAVEIRECKWYLIKETPQGYWITNHQPDCEGDILPFARKRWVSKNGTRRYAYPCKKLAIESFCARKRKQLGYAENTILTAKNALKKGRELLNTISGDTLSNEFNNLRARDKWDRLDEFKDKGQFYCPSCEHEPENGPQRANPFDGESVKCCWCSTELTHRTNGGQSDPFNWTFKAYDRSN